MSERITISDIAGFCPEEAVWKLLADVSQAAIEGATCTLTPSSVVCDGDSFIIEKSQDAGGFSAPEVQEHTAVGEAQMVWSLGALAYFSATGRQLFGGRGSAYQREHPSVALPGMPKGFQRTASLVRACLDFNPEKRPCMKDICEHAQKGQDSCKTQDFEHKGTKPFNLKSPSDTLGDKWPEKMIEV